MEKSHVTDITKALRTIEDIVLELDHAIDSNEIDPKALDNLKGRYDQASDLLADKMRHNEDSRYYIVDEAAGLFAWIKSEKDAAMGNIADAVARKGDASLTSQAGRGLAASVSASHAAIDDTTESPHKGWLGFFYIIVTIVMVPALLLAIGGSIGVAMMAANDRTVSTFLLLVLFYAYAGLSVLYVLSASRGLRRSVPAAIALFSLLSLGCTYLLIGPSLSGESAEMPAVYYASVLFLIACGISTVAYYSSSAKVRRVFTR